LVWTSKWNFLKGLYLFQRYLTFIDISLLLHCQSDAFPIFLPSYFVDKTGVGLTKTECRDLYYAIGGS
jgi:hypothetical protein